MKKFLKMAVILLAILVAGFITPLVNYESTITINKPLEETFSLFNDLDKLKEWIPEINHTK